MTDAGTAGPDPSGDVAPDDVAVGDQPVDDPTSGPTAAELTVEELVAEFERVVGERDQFRDAYQRTAADFDNFRKVAQRRQVDEVTRALGSFVDRLLPVLDACDGAVAHGSSEAVPIMTALLGALEKEGLSRVDPIGEPFDPTVAEAVVHEPGTGGEHVVSEVLRTGYLWQGKVLRPAMVKVTD